jgi:hypothetical protein
VRMGEGIYGAVPHLHCCSSFCESSQDGPLISLLGCRYEGLFAADVRWGLAILRHTQPLNSVLRPFT